MKRLLMAVLFTAATPMFAHAQPGNMPTAYRHDAAREANFLYEVKVIDEFIERFNDDPSSFLRKEYLRLGKPINFSRQQLVEYLFEKPVTPADGLVMKFVGQVIDSAHPQKLRFHDTDWYAEVMCGFSAGGKHIDIPLVMQIMPDTNRSVRWMISGIGDAPVFQEGGSAPAAAAANAVKDKKQYISPADYATNFLQFHMVLKPGFEAVNYMKPELMANERGQKFADMVKSGKLKFEGPGYMRFYFFQIPNYTFIVERFVRQTTHSGWLISDLTATTDDEKRARREKLLQRSL